MSVDPADALGWRLPPADPATLTDYEIYAHVALTRTAGLSEQAVRLFSIPASGQAGHS